MLYLTLFYLNGSPAVFQMSWVSWCFRFTCWLIPLPFSQVSLARSSSATVFVPPSSEEYKDENLSGVWVWRGRGVDPEPGLQDWLELWDPRETHHWPGISICVRATTRMKATDMLRMIWPGKWQIEKGKINHFDVPTYIYPTCFLLQLTHRDRKIRNAEKCKQSPECQIP